MVNKKIIHIFLSKAKYNPSVSSPEEYHLGSWAITFCLNLAKKKKTYDVECWSTYLVNEYAFHGISRLEINNVISKLFPAMNLFGFLFVPKLYFKIWEEYRKNKKVIFHFQSLHDINIYFIRLLFPKIKIICQHRVPSVAPFLRFQKFSGGFKYYILHLLEKFILKKIDFIFCSSKGEYYFLKNKMHLNNLFRQKGGGFDFSKYNIDDKSKLRRELGLPTNKKIILHIGRLIDRKGVSEIIDAFKLLNSKRKDSILVFVGGDQSQKYYSKATSMGALVVPHVPRLTAIKYVNASDVYVQFLKDTTWLPYEDVDNAILEALAMNTKVISPTLIQLKADKEDLHLMGNREILKNSKDLSNAIEVILSKSDRLDTRSLLKKYYSWDKILSNNVRIYERLLERTS